MLATFPKSVKGRLLSAAGIASYDAGLPTISVQRANHHRAQQVAQVAPQ